MSYTSEQIFFDNAINGLVDFFHEKVRAQFPNPIPENDGIAVTNFVLADEAAFQIQGKISSPLKQIVFKTDIEEIYNFIAFNMQKIIPQAKAISYTDKIFIYIGDYYFEVWFDASLTKKNITGIYMELI
jgi:hypothetical protein